MQARASRKRGYNNTDIMNVTDFSRSFLRFTSSRIGNTARLQLDALCTLTETASGRSTRYVLTAPCVAENMYQDSSLIQVPTCEFRMIASTEEYRMIKDYPTYDLDADMARMKDEKHSTFDGSQAQLTELSIFVREAEKTTGIEGYEEFKPPFLSNRNLVGTTELKSPDGTLTARMEYPIRTSNIQVSSGRWQVDAGPVLYPDFARKPKIRVEFFARAYIVFNDFAWAEIILHRPGSLMKDGKEAVRASHYHDPSRIQVPSRLFAVG